jgi:hypothetical protein
LGSKYDIEFVEASSKLAPLELKEKRKIEEKILAFTHK